MTPFPDSSTGPRSSTPSRSSFAAASAPASSDARLPSQAASPPSAAEPGRDVGALTAGREADARARVGSECEWLLQLHDDVEHEIAE